MRNYRVRGWQFNLLSATFVSVFALAAARGIPLVGRAAEDSNRENVLGPHRAAPKTLNSTTRRQPLPQRYGSLPLSFEANQGQTDPSVQFISHGAGYTLFLTQSEAVVALQTQDEPPLALQKMKPTKRKLIESEKFYRGSPRFRKARKTETIRVAMAGANSHASIEPLDELPGKSNHFIGNDPKKWRTGIPTFERVKYSEIYAGIDLVYYGKQRQLEFDFVVAPGADPHEIALKIQTDGQLVLTKSGNLWVKTDDGSIELRRPEIYQIRNSSKERVAGKFVQRRDDLIGFQLGAYDHRLQLVIDPGLTYSTYLGGNGADDGFGIAVDAAGNAYVVGQTTSTNFPAVNSYPSAFNANGIAFVSKLNPNGTALIYSTYLGGSGGESGDGIALDPSGNVYITGYTLSTDFPIVNAYQTTLASPSGNAFVSRIDTTQTGTASLIYSTYLGGGSNATYPYGDSGYGIAANASGLAYVTGMTTSDTSVAPFPTTASAFQSSLAGQVGNSFLTALDTTQTGSASMVYSTYLGGSGGLIGDFGLAVAVDASGNAYITGATSSGSPTPFPTTSNAYQTSLSNPYWDAFVTEIATTQSGSNSLVYSSYLGGSGDSSDESGDTGMAIALDLASKVYLAGAASSSDFPITSGAYQTTNYMHYRAFVSKLDLAQSGTQSLIYSTFLGGSNGDEGRGIAVGGNGNAYIGGATASADFPTTSGAFQTTLNNGSADGFVTELNPTATALVYSTYLGGSCANGDVGNGIAIDFQANPYLAGDTCSSDFPTYPSGAYQTSLAGTQNAFVTKFALDPNPGITASLSPSPDSSGWNNSAVTVSFTCVPGGAPISSCSSPATVNTEGASQIVSGTATDTASNSSSTSVTVNLDMTPPSLSITSPSSGSSVSTPYVTMTGSVSDSLSGVGTVACNGVTASISAGSFSCLVQLSLPSNTITVTGTDLAGNFTSSSVTVNIGMATPTSIQVTPNPVTVVIGNTQSFGAVDQGGTRRPDATWSVSDTSVATLASDGSGTITAVAAGTVTVTATVGSASGQSTVTVVSGSVTAGTVLWTAPVVSGFATQKILQAVPVTNGPDLYAIDTDSNGDLLIRAFKSDGEQLWQTEINLYSLNIYGFQQALGDNTGGILIVGSGSNSGIPFGAILDLNGQTGNQNWQYSTSGYSLLPGDAAVGLNGTVYTVEDDLATNADGQSVSYGYLDTINGATGALLNQVKLPYAYTYVNCIGYSQPSIAYNPGAYGPPMVAADGSVQLEAVGYQSIRNGGCEIGPPATYSYTDTLSLFQMQSDGSAQLQTLGSLSTSDGSEPVFEPGDVIPDGQGGVLATWLSSNSSSATVADISAQGTVQTTFSNVGDATSDNSLALGDNGTAFVTDGQSIVSFSVPGLSQLWTYQAQQSSIGFVSTAADAALVAKLTQSGGNGETDTVIRFDSTGNSTTDSWTAASVQYMYGNLWLARGSLDVLSAPPIQGPQSIWPRADQDGTRAPTQKLSLRVSIVNATSSITRTGVSAQVVRQQVNEAVRLWQLVSVGKVLLDWDGTIARVPACLAGDPQCNLHSLAEITDTSAPQLNTRFTNPHGSDLIFTIDIAVTKFGIVITADGLTPQLTSTGQYINKSALDANPGSTPVAHEIGHQLQLPHVLDTTNLMCGPLNAASIYINCDPNSSTYLTNDQISAALRGLNALR